MKKLILLISVFTLINGLNAQDEKTWYNLAIKGGYGNCIFFNANYSSDVAVDYNYMSPSFFYGLDAGVVFPGGFSLGLEYSIQKMGQEYDIVPVLGSAYTKRINVYSNDFLFLIRAFDEGFGYFEIGPKLSMVKKVTDKNSDNSLSYVNSGNYGEYYNDMFISIMFGFGIPVYHGDLFDFTIGLRGGYSISNLMLEEKAPINDLGYPVLAPDSYATTNPFFAQLTMRFDWHIGIKNTKSSG